MYIYQRANILVHELNLIFNLRRGIQHFILIWKLIVSENEINMKSIWNQNEINMKSIWNGFGMKKKKTGKNGTHFMTTIYTIEAESWSVLAFSFFQFYSKVVWLRFNMVSIMVWIWFHCYYKLSSSWVIMGRQHEWVWNLSEISGEYSRQKCLS